MRVRALASCVLFVAATSLGGPMITNPPAAPAPSPTVALAPRPFAPAIRRQPRRAMSADVDSRVLASLFAMAAHSDFDVAVRAGQITCDAHNCVVALTVQLPETTAPSRLSFAVAGPKGELSDVKHAECLVSLCSVQLVVERGKNTIAVGASDPLSHTAGFALTDINASTNLPLTARGKTEWF